MADGSGLRPLYPEADFEWVTHKAIITEDEVAIAIMGHRKMTIPGMEIDTSIPGQEQEWGPAGTKIEIQSALLPPGNKSMKICNIPLPEEWLKRKY